MITLATAHPAKFPDAVEAATGQRPDLPSRMADLYDRPERVTRVANDLSAIETLIRERIKHVTVELHRLSNGFRIVTEHMPGLQSAVARHLGSGRWPPRAARAKWHRTFP